jgi:hypothetical protein
LLWACDSAVSSITLLIHPISVRVSRMSFNLLATDYRQPPSGFGSDISS